MQKESQGNKDYRFMKAKVIAYYLPQYHPIPENDEWWGKGFTEWTNVGKAKKYFIGHEQPKVPADLGYYDLRLPQVRQAQADLAREAGISAFCYWHYWFGNGKQLLEMPLQEVVRLGEPDFPFCLGWANHSWDKRSWNGVGYGRIRRLINNNHILIKQEYPGKEDIDNHFYKMLPVFKDIRYYRIHGKLLFVIYKLDDIPDFKYFKNRWNELAQKNNLPGFFFVASSESMLDIDKDIFNQCDAISLCRLHLSLQSEHSFFLRYIKNIIRIISYITNISITKIEYSKVIQMLDSPVLKNKRIYPVLIPNWDNSPRRGAHATIYINSTPKLFKEHIKKTLVHLSEKEDEDKILFLKSWNEWAEGNYMEPDLRWGKGYINALREALKDG
jgi:hypothetical protein